MKKKRLLKESGHPDVYFNDDLNPLRVKMIKAVHINAFVDAGRIVVYNGSQRLIMQSPNDLAKCGIEITGDLFHKLGFVTSPEMVKIPGEHDQPGTVSEGGTGSEEGAPVNRRVTGEPGPGEQEDQQSSVEVDYRTAMRPLNLFLSRIPSAILHIASVCTEKIEPRNINNIGQP